MIASGTKLGDDFFFTKGRNLNCSILEDNLIFLEKEDEPICE